MRIRVSAKRELASFHKDELGRVTDSKERISVRVDILTQTPTTYTNM